VTDLAPAMDAVAVARIQRRTVTVLAAGQVLGGIAFGATVSLGALLAADLSGKEALSGLATASVTSGRPVRHPARAWRGGAGDGWP
jgi:hypothetical protein